MPKLLKVLSTAPHVKGTTIIANLYQCFGNVGMSFTKAKDETAQRFRT